MTLPNAVRLLTSPASAYLLVQFHPPRIDIAAAVNDNLRHTDYHAYLQQRLTSIAMFAGIVIEGRVTFINVWTDDCDGVCDDPRDGQAIKEAFNQKFGVTECDPRYMLGVQRDWSDEDGVTVSRHTQVAYIEALWDTYKEERKGRTQPRWPADDLSFTDADNEIIVPQRLDSKISRGLILSDFG